MAQPILKSIPRRSMLLLCLLIAVACIICSPAVRAYHFFYVKAPAPAKWATLPVNFSVDNGPVNILPEIQTAFNTWNNISTAKNVLGTATLASGDFNGTNFGTSWGNMTGDGKQEVVFDEDGSALARLGANPAAVNGRGPTMKDPNTGAIIDAYLIINGKRTDFDRQSTEVHELGHIQGLAHSSVGMHNSASFPSDALDPISINAVPTMHPYSDNTGTNRRTPEADDIAALSELYPEASFSTSFGSIQGTITRCAGDKGVTGANVRAINIANPNIQLSRFTGFDGNSDGRFVINGIPPGTYKLVVEPMGANNFDIAVNFGTPPNASENDFATEYYNPPDEDSCTEELPDKPVNITVTAGATTTGKNIKVGAVDLAFVVDDTGSMGPEIGGVRTALTQFVNVMDGINRVTGIRFPNTAVITFKDDVTKRVISNDPTRLKSIIGALTATGGGDCAESSNAAVLAAGRLLKKGGVAILFTDADSRPDGPDRNSVTQLYRSKSLILATLLSGACTGSLAAPSESTQPRLPVDQTTPPAATDFDELPPPAKLGIESGVRTFSEESILTGGIFTSIPGIKAGDTTETQRYINTGTNLSVSSVVPAVSLVTPGDGPQTGTLNIEIFGSNTNFQTSSKVEISGTGITVNSRTVESPEKITANITIQPGATTGFRDVTVNTTLGAGITETATGFGAFNVVTPPGAPRVIGVTPNQGGQGVTTNVTISGISTHFSNGASVATFGADITVNSLTVLSATSAVANITISPAAAVGLRDVQVKTGVETATESMVGPFLVTAPTPAIPLVTDLSPLQGKQDQTITLTITGKNTNFSSANSVVSFSGSGIVVNSATVNSPTSVTANISIAANAALGFRDVFVTTGGEIASSLSAFQVACNPLLAPQTLQFNNASFSASESSGSVLVTVTRNACEATGTLTVGYATSNGTAKEGRDYTAASGTLTFAAGETTKTFPILVIDNAFVDGSRSVNLTLSNATGASLAAPNTGVLTIADNDTTSGINPLDVPRSFVQLDYYDFLGRYPDQSGWDFWTGQITNCGSNLQCTEVARINVSASFFLSIEFQQTGYLVERFYKVAYGNAAGNSTFGGAHTLAVPIIRFDEFLRDSQRVGRGVVVLAIGWEQLLEANKQAYAGEFVQTMRFITAFPTSMTPTQFVDQLNQRAGNVLSATERTTAINLFAGAATSSNVTARAQAVRQVAEDVDLYNAEYNRGFVLAEYYGYLRRNPNDAPESTLDYTGYDFWLTKLNQFNGNYLNAEMVKAFLSSIEYRKRFGP